MSAHKQQTAIAAFLDRETENRCAGEEQRRFIALLKEKRRAVISHAVTKGLDPSASMKDSGIEWPGEVPAHWEVGSPPHLRKALFEAIIDAFDAHQSMSKQALDSTSVRAG